MAIGLATAAWKTSARGVTLAALAMVVFQGLLGGITVLLRLPTLVSTSHLATAMLFFSLTIFLVFRLRPGATEGTESLPRVRKLALFGMAAVYFQIVLGALVRHTLSGRACLDLPLCGGEWWPAYGPAALHMLHRYVAVGIVVAVIAASVAALRALRGTDRPIARLAASVAPWIALLQVAVGVLMVFRKIEWVSAVAHTGVAALLLGAFVVLFLGSGPLADPATFSNQERTVGQMQPEGGTA
jgi:heme A synthase